MSSDDGLVYFEDLEIGAKASFGHYEVTREEVIDFATKYDPQPFHLSDEAAAQTHFGRISASGWHTCAMVMRMLVDNITERRQAGIGMTESGDWSHSEAAPELRRDASRCDAGPPLSALPTAVPHYRE